MAYRDAAEQSEPDREPGPSLKGAPRASWLALRRRWRWWVRLGSPWARRRREAARAEWRLRSQVDRWAHRTGFAREQVEKLWAMGLTVEQLLDKLQPFVDVFGKMKPVDTPRVPEPRGRRPPRKAWRVTREGRWVRE